MGRKDRFPRGSVIFQCTADVFGVTEAERTIGNGIMAWYDCMRVSGDPTIRNAAVFQAFLPSTFALDGGVGWGSPHISGRLAKALVEAVNITEPELYAVWRHDILSKSQYDPISLMNPHVQWIRAAARKVFPICRGI